MKEPLVITHHQNKTLTPVAGSVVGDGGAMKEWGRWGRRRRMEAGKSEGRRDRKTRGEELEDTRETRRIHSGERCLSTVVNPLQGLVSCQTS